jgi:NADPH:quinone reductase-like Zn-dependent oxidoreductase
MKALYFEEHGELDVIQYGDVPDPEPGPGQVKMKVRATALNYLDIWVRRGWPGLKLEMPHWCGADMAGEIVELGKGVSDWQVGQRVVADPGINSLEDEFTRRGEDSVSPGYHVLGEHQRGGAAEYIVLPANGVAAMPDHVDFAEAAAPLLVTLTAWRMLNNRAGLRAGESVLVVGSGGGVNSMSIQVAKLAGAFVYAVAGNQKKAQLAKELGAERGVDVVVDNVGKATLTTSMQALARGGRIVIVGNTSGPLTEIDIRYIFGKQISLIGSTMGSHQDFKDVVAMLWAGKLKPVIDRVMPLSEGRKAYEIMQEGGQLGKIVLTP